MSTKICLDCMYYVNRKMTGKEQAEAVASILQTTQVTEEVIGSAILINGLDCSLEDVKNVLAGSHEIPHCQEYAKRIGCENICKLCSFSTFYTQENVEPEERLLNICINDQEQFNKLIDFLTKDMPENSNLEQYAEELSDRLFHAEYMLSCQNAENIVLMQLHRMIFLSLLKKLDNTDNIIEYIQSAIDEQVSCLNCDSIMKKKYLGEIERIANLTLTVESEKKDAVGIATIILNSKSEQAGFSTTGTTSKSQTAEADLIEDVDFINWSYEEKQNTDEPSETPAGEPKTETENVDEVVPDTLPDPSTVETEQPSADEKDGEETTEETVAFSDETDTSDVCVSGYLNQNGFLYNHIVMPEDAKYTYVSNPKEELMLKYAIMLDFDVAVEPAIWKENGKQGLLLYFFKDKYFYFLPFEHMKEISFCALRGLFTESYHTVYTMISIPLFYRLFTLELEEVNVLSLYDLYTVVNGEPCEEPYNIIRMVTTEFEKDPETYLPYTMQFYKSIAKKYMHRCEAVHQKKVAQVSYQNHTISMSYSLKNVCNVQQPYLSFANGVCSYAYQELTDFSLSGNKLRISYKNPVDNSSRYQNAFLQVMQKLYTCRVYKTCRYYILDFQDDYMEIYVAEKSKEEFLSVLHHLLIKAGQRYISDVPHVEIIS